MKEPTYQIRCVARRSTLNESENESKSTKRKPAHRIHTYTSSYLYANMLERIVQSM